MRQIIFTGEANHLFIDEALATAVALSAASTRLSAEAKRAKLFSFSFSLFFFIFKLLGRVFMSVRATVKASVKACVQASPRASARSIYWLGILAMLFLTLGPIIGSATLEIKFGEAFSNASGAGEISFTAHEGDYEVCNGEHFVIPVRIKNTNAFQEQLGFSLDKGYAKLSSSKAILEPGKASLLLIDVDFPYDVSPFDPSGTETISLAIRSEKERVKRTVSAGIFFEKCYDLALEAEKEPGELCGCDPAEYSFLLLNKGLRRDTYHVEVSYPEGLNSSMANSTAELAAGKSQKISFSGNLPCDAVESEVTVSAVSEGSGEKKSAGRTMPVAPFEQCYSTEISIKNKRIGYGGENVPFTVRNKGTRAAEYAVSVDGILWYSLSSEEFKLGPGGEKTLILRLEPGEDAPEGNYPLTIRLAGEQFEVKREVIFTLRKKPEIIERLAAYVFFSRYYIGAGVIIAFLVLFLFLFKKPKSQEDKGKVAEPPKVPEDRRKLSKVAMAAEKAFGKLEERKMMRWRTFLTVVLVIIIIGGFIFGVEYAKKKAGVEAVKGFIARYGLYIAGGVAALVVVGFALKLFKGKGKKGK
ncbi:hypothetical protein HYU14_02830 [Candidatus Woesearchaeota archaeon]|nr:hypothetical protein [Candidatus Woesearchaeota archaeon]